MALTLARAYPGPAILLNGEGDLVLANGAARALVAHMTGQDGEALREAIVNRMTTGGGGNVRVSFEVNGVERTLELTLTTLAESASCVQEGVLILGRDVTGERNVINALVSSRQLYRDLVECSADFGWETDVDGAFTYVSPQGGFGYSARELTSTLASDLLENPGGGNPFNAQHRYRNVEVWIARKDGGRACLVVSAVPIHDAHGRWTGSRGMCRDVSAVKAHLLQEEILSRIVDAIRNCIDPRHGLEIAACHIVEVFSSARSLVAKKTAEGFQLAAQHGFDDEGAEKALQRFCSVLEETKDQGRSLIEYTDKVNRVLTAPSYHHGVVNGVVLAERALDDGIWSDQERHLLRGIVDQFGVAIEQVNNYEALEDLTRVDDLTGLLNRRAFNSMVEPRILHQRRTGRSAGLLYLDIDNFKMVNDVLGHQEGDRVLQDIGTIINGKSRAGDIAARVGGDEFLIWLEDTEIDGAMKKARSLIEDIEGLNASLQGCDGKLGLSVGIAMSIPSEGGTLAELVRRSDEAMYDVKRGGKSGLSVYERGDKAEAC
jgi:diguanylate cyclase (GGDEF)-like protein/PAS domain S-box-containing protein